ncbi:MAG: hypothetical protein V4717_11355 [Bacteroidota bacterium]
MAGNCLYCLDNCQLSFNIQAGVQVYLFFKEVVVLVWDIFLNIDSQLEKVIINLEKSEPTGQYEYFQKLTLGNSINMFPNVTSGMLRFAGMNLAFFLEFVPFFIKLKELTSDISLSRSATGTLLFNIFRWLLLIDQSKQVENCYSRQFLH